MSPIIPPFLGMPVLARLVILGLLVEEKLSLKGEIL